MGRAADLVGQRFGRLVVVSHYPVSHDKQHKYWLCKCDCGADTISETSSLRLGVKKSCGCLKQEMNTKHGMYHTHLYNVWQNMKYGGHKKYGLYLYDKWKEFNEFKDWALSTGYEEDRKMSLVRLVPSAGYSPDNCTWKC